MTPHPPELVERVALAIYAECHAKMPKPKDAAGYWAWGDTSDDVKENARIVARFCLDLAERAAEAAQCRQGCCPAPSVAVREAVEGA